MRSSSSSSATRDRARKLSAWGLPVCATILLAAVGWGALRVVERSYQEKLRQELTTILRADVAALKTWLEGHKATARATATRPDVIKAARELSGIEREAGSALAALRRLELLTELNVIFQSIFESHGYEGFALIDGGGKIVCAFDPRYIGQRVTAEQLPTIARAMDGETVITRPFYWQRFPSSNPLFSNASDSNPIGEGLPTIFVATPIREDTGQTLVTLALRIPPGQGFTDTLQVARSGETGETYAFDHDGTLLSDSRFESQLREIGLLAEDPRIKALLNVAIRDPEANLTRGQRAKKSRDEQPLTAMAAAAIAQGNRGDDSVAVRVAPYNDYRGVPVVGAWTWLPEYEFGVATEADVTEAFAPLLLLRTVFFGLFAMVVASAATILVLVQAIRATKRVMRRSQRQVETLGQYSLEDKIGEGGMGEVYRASHALLRRPTAVKLLRPERSGEKAIARFEREVQLTSQLSHANTIVIFDYGRTPEGIFYYAMEYLDGVDLTRVVEYGGPLPEGRVIHILRQVCGSLAEAHESDLIHRDIKPANIMLCQRGGQADLVKVLDFGLVKDIGDEDAPELSMPGAITGTPLYMAPESIASARRADARSDIYAVGAVGYFLLTGQHVFDRESSTAIMHAHVSTLPVAPSARLHRPIADDLERVILRCLAKAPDDRPQSADELMEALEACASTSPWTRGEARQWWADFRAAPKGTRAVRALFSNTGGDQETVLEGKLPPV